MDDLDELSAKGLAAVAVKRARMARREPSYSAAGRQETLRLAITILDEGATDTSRPDIFDAARSLLQSKLI